MCRNSCATVVEMGKKYRGTRLRTGFVGGKMKVWSSYMGWLAEGICM